ncbi:MAG: DUF87 domain-containing protein [Euryarchaeota archaeon]|nr:DUF87 domain-containing protein [Euryarchaeota archaeon]MBU4031898.1 ATP-binding protein [Candidatus Thermoplasmatota archaeon]MBU4143325.1 ATP-binding protein [Candidatus Thermoplasmatota archaeon]
MKSFQKTIKIAKISEFNPVIFLRGLVGTGIGCNLHVYTGSQSYVHLSTVGTGFSIVKALKRAELNQKILESLLYTVKFEEVDEEPVIRAGKCSTLFEIVSPQSMEYQEQFHFLCSRLFSAGVPCHMIVKVSPVAIGYDYYEDDTLGMKSKSPISSQLQKLEIKEELDLFMDSAFEVTFGVFITANSDYQLKRWASIALSYLTSTYNINGVHSQCIQYDGKRAIGAFNRVMAGGHLNSSVITSKNLAAYFQIPAIGPLEPRVEIDFPTPELGQNGIKLGNVLAPDNDVMGDAIFDPCSIFEHIAIWGATGTGKSTLLKRMIIELHNNAGLRLIIFDLHDEYREIISHLNGEIGKDITIINPILQKFSVNPLELFTQDAVSRDIAVAERTENFISLLKQVFILGEIQESRVRAGIYSLYNSGTPTIEDLVKVLLSQKIDNLSGKLMKFTRGFYGNIFNVKSSSLPFDKLETTTTIFELGRLPTGMRCFFVSVFLILWWDYKRRNRPSEATPHVMVLDEFHHYSGLSVINKMLSEARKYKEGLICSHQGPNQVTSNNVLDNLVRNTATKIIFRQEQASDKHTVSTALGGLSKEQAAYLSVMDVGEAIVKLKGVKTAFRIRTDDFQAGTPIDDDQVRQIVLNDQMITSIEQLSDDEIRFLKAVYEHPRSRVADVSKNLKIRNLDGYALFNGLKQRGALIEETVKHGVGRPKNILSLSVQAHRVLDLGRRSESAHHGGTEHIEMGRSIADILEADGWNCLIEDGCDVKAERDGFIIAIEVETGKAKTRSHLIKNLERDSWADIIIVVCPNKVDKQEIEKIIARNNIGNVFVITYGTVESIMDLIP